MRKRISILCLAFFVLLPLSGMARDTIQPYDQYRLIVLSSNRLMNANVEFIGEGSRYNGYRLSSGQGAMLQGHMVNFPAYSGVSSVATYSETGGVLTLVSKKLQMYCPNETYFPVPQRFHTGVGTLVIDRATNKMGFKFRIDGATSDYCWTADASGNYALLPTVPAT